MFHRMFSLHTYVLFIVESAVLSIGELSLGGVFSGVNALEDGVGGRSWRQTANAATVVAGAKNSSLTNSSIFLKILHFKKKHINGNI